MLSEQNLDANVIHELGIFAKNVCRKPITSSEYTCFDSFSPSAFKIGMMYILVNRYFRICSNWSAFHSQLTILREIFQKNGYPKNFIDTCFKLFLNRI